MATTGLPSVAWQLARDEGCKLKPYLDTRGKLTIGFGRNLEDDGISKAEANALLNNDIQRVTDDLRLALPWMMGLDPARQGVLVNMAFNLGISGLLECGQFLNYVKLGQFGQAAADMLFTEWAHQVGARASRLAEQMRTGAWV